MSEPFSSTGETRTAPCPKCGAMVTEQHCVGLYGSEQWFRPRHDAPCGLPCFGAGVSPKAYRSGQIHRDAEHCPACDRARAAQGGGAIAVHEKAGGK